MNYYETLSKQACTNLSNFDIINKLKLDIEGEIATIELYQQHINNIIDSTITAVLIEIMNDEKEHLMKLNKILAKLSNG
jgi:rubrerythrin